MLARLRFRARQHERFEIGQRDGERHFALGRTLQEKKQVALLVATLAELHVVCDA